MHTLPDALAPLAAYKQFIVYKLLPGSKPGKTDKRPVDYRTGRVTLKGQGGAHDPAIWVGFATAASVAASCGAGHGVGFVFTTQDPFWFIDIDNCAVPGGWSPIVHELCALFSGAAVEVSQSGRGLHIIGTGTAPTPRRCKDTTGELFDLYTERRFVALTGTNAFGDAATSHTPALCALVQKYLTPGADEIAGGQEGWTEAPCDGWRGPADDTELLRRAMQSRSASAAFGGGASFSDLWNANADVLAHAYPPDGNGTAPYDESRADAALIQHLAFWTGKDCERIKSLAFQSGLVREKWEQREDYVDDTILKACRIARDVLTDKAPEPLAGATIAPAAVGDLALGAECAGGAFLSVGEQIKLFEGCVYVRDQHKVLVKGGVLLKEGQFKVMFGGYQAAIDKANTKYSRCAWEIFTQSQCWRAPRVGAATFRPDMAAGAIITQDGDTLVNTYWPIETPRMQGDITPFAVHLAKVLPNERDRTILLSYMAAVVQHKGVKFQWAPLLQGVEGNGKSLFTRCVAFAVGDRYSYLPAAQDLADKFNDWMAGTIFIGVEDIYVPDDRSDVIEALKPMITSERQQIQGKGKDKYAGRVCCNWILNSNHQNGIRKTDKDRRYAPLFCAQQTVADMARDGMMGDYFPDLYDWLRGDGYAIVSELLHTYPIPDEFNPATACKRAPLTSSTGEAITAGRGGIEQEIIEAVAQGLPGFAGGWISSIMLDRLLDRINVRRTNQNMRRDLLIGLGYQLHPGLPDGRVNNPVTPDAGKPRLFVKTGHPAMHLAGPAVIANAYTTAQESPVPSFN